MICFIMLQHVELKTSVKVCTEHQLPKARYFINNPHCQAVKEHSVAINCRFTQKINQVHTVYYNNRLRLIRVVSDQVNHSG